MMTDDSLGVTAQLGISIEPLAAIQAQLDTRPTETALVKSTSVTDVSPIALKLIESSGIDLDFYNYCSSFATHLPRDATVLFGMDWSNSFIPIKVICVHLGAIRLVSQHSTQSQG